MARATKWIVGITAALVPVFGLAGTAHAGLLGYVIAGQPLSVAAGGTVHVTGTDPNDVCPSADVTVTLTYFTAGGVQKTTQTDFGQADGNGNSSGDVAIPSDAGPTSVSGHTANIQAACSQSVSNVLDVTITGSAATTTTAPPMTTPATAPTTTPPTTSAPATTIAPATTLPRTGANNGALLLVGALAVGLGALLLASQRRRRAST